MKTVFLGLLATLILSSLVEGGYIGKVQPKQPKSSTATGITATTTTLNMRNKAFELSNEALDTHVRANNCRKEIK